MILDHENLNLGCVRFHFCSLISKSAIKSVKTQKMGFLQNTEKVRLKKNLYRRFYINLFVDAKAALGFQVQMSIPLII